MANMHLAPQTNYESEQQENERLLRSQLAELGGRLTADDDVVFTGTKFVLPATMGLIEAVDWLKKRIRADEEKNNFTRTFRYRPWDGGHATLTAFKKHFGGLTGKTLHTFFGDIPPTLITINVGPNQTEQIPWGAVQMPLVNGVVHLGMVPDEEWGPLFHVRIEAPRRYRHEVEGIFKIIEAELGSSSMYKGAAINGRDNAEFIDLRGVDPRKVVYSDEVRTQLLANVWSLIMQTDKMRELGIPLKRAVLLEGPFGCLAGDTKISINRAGNGTQITIKDLVSRLKGEHAGRSWDPSIPVMVQREMPDGTLRLGQLSDAWCSGRKQTFTVVTNKGRSVRASANHPFLTERGWVSVSDLVIGDVVHVRGAQSTGTGTVRTRGERPTYRQLSVGPHHPYGKGYSRSTGWHVAEHRLMVEADENGLGLEEFLAKVKAGDIGTFKFIDPTQWFVHHRDDDSTNNALSNLEKISHRDHHVLHGASNATNVLYKVATETIVSIEAHGEEMTYDLEVIGEPHNFTANGFVVHNCGKSLGAFLTAQLCVTHGWTFIYCRPAKDNLDLVMQTARLYQPAVVFFEDVDTIANNGEADAVTRLLDMFDGITAKGTELMVVLTTNNPERIHKGMLRPGRLDSIIHIGALDVGGMEQLIRTSVPTQFLADDIDYEAIGEAMTGFLPAFVKETIDRTLRYALVRAGGMPEKLVTEDFVNAAIGLRPQLELMEAAGEGTLPDTLGQAMERSIAAAVAEVVSATVVDPEGHNWSLGVTEEDAIKA